jgi:hypothetical protein
VAGAPFVAGASVFGLMMPFAIIASRIALVRSGISLNAGVSFGAAFAVDGAPFGDAEGVEGTGDAAGIAVGASGAAVVVSAVGVTAASVIGGFSALLRAQF